jgi:alkylation response protein AidB-like acyl-CoA dehydrogenase
LITSAVYADPTDGPTVPHVSVPLRAPGVTVFDNWRTMAMRASGSNDIVLDGVFVPDNMVSSRRPKAV